MLGTFEKIEMTQDQKIEYVKGLLDGGGKLEGVEGEILDQLRLSRNKLTAMTGQIAHLKQQLVKSAEMEASLAGQCEVLADLLCSVKEKRDFNGMREKKKESKVAQLEVNE